MPPRICVILLNWNGKKDTLECLGSLANSIYSRSTTIVIDNGSTDDSVSAIRNAYPHVPIFETGQNLGFAEGNNVGIRWALSKPFQWIFLLNNDTIIAPDCLSALLETAQSTSANIVGAKILRYADPTRIDHLGGTWNPARAEFDLISEGALDSDFLNSECVDYVCGAALLMHRSVPETIGLLEPKFFLFWEENDFCFRARRKGFAVRTAPLAKVWHKGSSSFVGGKPHAHYFWWRSRLLWLERNLPYAERQHIMRTVVRPELIKALRHYILKSLQRLWSRPNEKLDRKIKTLRAGLVGALHYYLGKFGGCPEWILKG